MPTPTDLQSEFRRLQEELQAEIAKLSLRLERLEGRAPPVDVECNVPRGLGDLTDEVALDESAWSFPLVIGLAPAGPWDVAFAITLLLLNLGRPERRAM